MMRALLLLPVIALMSIPSGCSGGVRWHPYAPAQVRSRGQASLVYLRMKARLHQLGYQIQEADPQRRYIRVMARLDEEFAGAPQWSATQASLFHLQIRESGSAEITVTGRHLKRRPEGDLIHYRLDEELHRLTKALESSAIAPVQTESE